MFVKNILSILMKTVRFTEEPHHTIPFDHVQSFVPRPFAIQLRLLCLKLFFLIYSHICRHVRNILQQSLKISDPLLQRGRSDRFLGLVPPCVLVASCLAVFRCGQLFRMEPSCRRHCEALGLVNDENEFQRRFWPQTPSRVMAVRSW